MIGRVNSEIWKSAAAFVAGAAFTALVGVILLNQGVRLVAPTTSTPLGASPQAAQQVEEGAGQIPGPSRFAVHFGRYNRSDTAEARARLVRSKGYLASVSQVGTRFLVVSRPYENAFRAGQWCRIFREIGLSGRLVAWSDVGRAQ